MFKQFIFLLLVVTSSFFVLKFINGGLFKPKILFRIFDHSFPQTETTQPTVCLYIPC